MVPPLMGWMAPAPGIAMCHGGCCRTVHRREPSMDKPATIGLDLAKSVFQSEAGQRSWMDPRSPAERRERRRHGRAAPAAAPGPGPGLLRAPGALPDRDGGLLGRALLGAGTRHPWPRGAADAGSLREAVCKARQDRPGGRRGDLRGGDPAHHADHARGVPSARRR